MSERKTEIEVEISVYCETCGSDLCGETRVFGTEINVEVCPSCIKEKDNEIITLEERVKELEKKIESLED